jgi:hypothetical protein
MTELITSTEPKKTSTRKKRLLLFFAALLILSGGVAAFVLVPKYLAEKETIETSKKVESAATKLGEQVRQQTLDATAGQDATADQQYVLLMAKVNTESIAGNWSGVKNYAQQALALKGHASDSAALSQLAAAQKNLGDKTGYQQTLKQIKDNLDRQGLTNTDYYKSIVEELSK